MDLYYGIVQQGAFLVPIVMAIVEYIKGYGVEGNNLRVASMVSGVVIGSPFAYFTIAPTDGQTWFVVILFGIAVGLVSSGLYDMGTSIARKDQT